MKALFRERTVSLLLKDLRSILIVSDFPHIDLNCSFTSAYVTCEDVCRIAAFRDQTVIAIKAPEEKNKDCIKIHLKGSRGPIHVLTCETNEADATTQSEQLKNGRFLTLEESRIETTPLLADLPTVSSAVRSA
ncbi:hypothetical protein AMELA_G00151940 [Ameiurus melas]|uniref:E2F transcription factor CC-MB domain-containing protein n=1 Tax=Ameiurus melas TaxID=219545 RepID=A0A7J6AKE3_AMEME|nr:hypothetical protein AMELA_G00151940 [Ameiurus melas]